jgi:hypothetical protein
MIELGADSQRRQHLGRAARARAEAEFDRVKMAARFREHLESLG